ncbi:MAG: hydrogenase iron-sulfur subunit [Methanomassiliicoccales archaeon]|nr:MAG: hydrogenase iron-sulfur subunit [Methanomassiliicoccales archaeon]
MVTDTKAEETVDAPNENEKKFEPKIIGFLCNWCSYTGADLAGVSRLQYPPNFIPIRVMCTGAVDPVYVIKALLEGADAVLVAGCHPGDCHYLSGNYKARRRIAILKKLLEDIGLEEKRVRLEWISASEGQKFADTVNEMMKETIKLGPNPIKSEWDI